MKTFEEKLTAWIDGELAGEELRSFEDEIAGNAEVLSLREESLQLRRLLKTNVKDRELTNPDFFNHQLMDRIAAEQVKSEPRKLETVWRLPRLLWAGAGAVAAAILLFFALIPPTSEQDPQSAYVAQILNTKAAEPDVSAVAFHSDQNDVTVLWLEGLKYEEEIH